MTASKKTVVLGASTNPSRYSYMATHRLLEHGHEVVPVSMSKGQIAGVKIDNSFAFVDGVHTVTVYLNPAKQAAYYDYILGLKPQRIVFNPGAENSELATMAKEQGIEVVEACTLVLLSINNY